MSHNRDETKGKMNRSFKAAKDSLGGRAHLKLRKNSKHVWLILYDDLRIIGTIDSRTTLKRLAHSILEAYGESPNDE